MKNAEKIFDAPDKKLKEVPDRESGRHIAGLPNMEERFTTLKEGRDYEILKVNKNVKSNQPIEDFFVFVNPKKGDKILVVKAPHWRSITTPGLKALATISLVDNQGFHDENVPFYEANTKGVGYLKPSITGKYLSKEYSWMQDLGEEEHDFGKKVYGLLSRSESMTDGNLVVNSQYYVQNGLRCELFWGIGRLKQVPYLGKLVTIDELRSLGVIMKRRDYVPTMAVRLLKTNDRIAEADDSDERRGEIFQNAFEIFNKETEDRGSDFPKLDIKNPEHQKIWFKEFFKRMGENLATTLNLGIYHFTLHSANLTMAAEIADVANFMYWKDNMDEEFSKKFYGVRRSNIKDMRDVAYGLNKLTSAGLKNHMHTGSRENLVSSFMDGFNKILNPDKLKKEETNVANAKKWVKKILEAIIVEGRHLGSLLYGRNEVTDWGIKL